MLVEKIKLEEILPYAKNTKIHPPEQIEKIASSIREFGFTNPLLITDDKTIIAGHGRFEAAKRLGLEDVPCIKLSHLSDRQRRAYALVDNRIAEGSTWDAEFLTLELEDLGEEFKLNEFDFNLDIFEPNLPGEDEGEGEGDREEKNTLIVSCKNKEELESLFQELNERGLKVKVKI